VRRWGEALVPQSPGGGGSGKADVTYWKAEQLLTLATLAASRRGGVGLEEVMERFAISKRTAQRMLRALETQFTDTQTSTAPDGRKRWHLPSGALRDLMSLSAEELAALDLAIEGLKRSGLDVEAEDLLNLREKILALVPRAKAARLETDHEALLEAQGLAARPGPRQRIPRKIIAAIAEAIKACRILEVEYQSRGETEPRPRRLAPYGLLTGLRRYLVARPDDDPSGPVRLYVVERIRAAKVASESFERDRDFNLRAFANRAFGVFQDEKEFGEVVWRFQPGAAAHARGFEFHPSQVLEDQPDGSLIVRFSASGHLEMCWHLYLWGDQVEVLAPERLREMVHPWRRSDFPSLP
jgi:predicted DNA-binding transcriptional regulator YafY